MIKFRRQIFLRDKKFETWFGLDIKNKSGRPNVSIYYYTADPKDKLAVSHFIKGDFRSKEDAVRYGIGHMKRLYQELLSRQRYNK